ncbi:MAG: HAMP domain-containing protein [Desulfuromusa sp.]|nr:HAMP domain-containing protein [Desulfuromusa sp.]
MKLNSIQSKIGGALILILLIILGISFTVAALQSRKLLRTQQEHSLKAFHSGALNEAHSIFKCLEIGTKGSLERGEMDVFDELLTGLGTVPGVLEVGLVDPQGVTTYSSKKDKLGQKKSQINISGSNEKLNIKKESTDTFFVAHSHTFEEKCMECHDDVEIGSLAGILFLDFSLAKLKKEEARQSKALAAASSKSMASNLGMGLISIIITWLALFFMLRKMIVRPINKVKTLLTEIGKGHLNNRLKLTQQDELGDTARTLDALADSLQVDIVGPLQQLANGDLTFEVTPHDENDTLRHAIKKLGEDLTQMVSGLQIAGQQIDSGSSQVSDSAQLLSDGAAQSAASVEEISSSMNEIGSQTSTSAENAQQANQLSASAQEAANTGSERMTEMIGAMGEINEAGQNISKIIKVIDEIAFQTNLLALNAAVEAARAGQHGKGFAVVAEEVRNLAARSAKAAAETAELIEGSVEKTSNGTRIAERTSEALEEIVGSIGKVTDLIGEIAASSNEQAQGIAQVNIGMQQIDQVIQQNTATAEESAATSEELSSQAAELRSQLGRFKLKSSSGFSAPPLPIPQLPENKSGW